MNANRNFLTAVLLFTVFGVGTSIAADNSSLLNKGFFGSPAQAKPDTTIKLSKATGSIYVDHFATARFENDKGETFVWRFDSAMEMSNFPLNIIAPRGFDAGKTRAIVIHPNGHFN
ncbi:MAG: CzcE family metal-binding protein [Betaproteobacteria bacterium]|nr:CzcE family metal-binding protein [Betaproteobacteria bacterium]